MHRSNQPSEKNYYKVIIGVIIDNQESLCDALYTRYEIIQTQNMQDRKHNAELRERDHGQRRKKKKGER